MATCRFGTGIHLLYVVGLCLKNEGTSCVECEVRTNCPKVPSDQQLRRGKGLEEPDLPVFFRNTVLKNYGGTVRISPRPERPVCPQTGYYCYCVCRLD